MKGKSLLIGGIVALVMVLVALAAAWFLVLRPTAEASGPITSVPIDLSGTELDDGASGSVGANVNPVDDGTSDSEDAASDPEETAAAVGDATSSSETSAGGETDDTTPEGDGAVAGSGTIIFVITGEESEARFILDELLRGQPTTVVGVTNQVAGEIAVNPENPTAAQVGIIQVNARTLATDNSMRNRAIGNRILQTGDFEFITFTPSSVSGLPDSVLVGESFSFKVTGDLTIRDITNTETLQVTVTPVTDTRLEGLASTTISRGDYQLTIPSVPSVADVDEEVVIELEFVAVSGG